MARLVASRSTCVRRHVGAVLVKDGHVLSTGYNGAPRGEPHCTEVGCSKPEHATRMEECKAVHAEMNAIVQAAIHGVNIAGATLYCTTQPCVMCSRVLKNAGIVDIIWDENYE
jgi:dCMP deaminase